MAIQSYDDDDDDDDDDDEEEVIQLQSEFATEVTYSKSDTKSWPIATPAAPSMSIKSKSDSKSDRTAPTSTTNIATSKLVEKEGVNPPLPKESTDSKEPEDDIGDLALAVKKKKKSKRSKKK